MKGPKAKNQVAAGTSIQTSPAEQDAVNKEAVKAAFVELFKRSRDSCRNALQDVFLKHVPVIVLGSGFSCGYGFPSMVDLRKRILRELRAAEDPAADSANSSEKTALSAAASSVEDGDDEDTAAERSVSDLTSSPASCGQQATVALKPEAADSRHQDSLYRLLKHSQHGDPSSNPNLSYSSSAGCAGNDPTYKFFDAEDLKEKELREFKRQLDDNKDLGLEEAIDQSSLNEKARQVQQLIIWQHLVEADRKYFKYCLVSKITGKRPSAGKSSGGENSPWPSSFKKHPLRNLIPKLHNSGKPLIIVTTNYDHIAEHEISLAEHACFNGFSRDYIGKSILDKLCFKFDPSIASSEEVVWLYKVHGSLDWFQKSGDNFAEPLELKNYALTPFDLAELNLQPLIVPPCRDKYAYTHFEPFRSLIYLSDKAFAEASNFLCVGYGFNDAHIQERLLRQIRRGKPTVILAKSLTDRCREELTGSAGTHVFLALEEITLWDFSALPQDEPWDKYQIDDVDGRRSSIADLVKELKERAESWGFTASCSGGRMSYSPEVRAFLSKTAVKDFIAGLSADDTKESRSAAQPQNSCKQQLQKSCNQLQQNTSAMPPEEQVKLTEADFFNSLGAEVCRTLNCTKAADGADPSSSSSSSSAPSSAASFPASKDAAGRTAGNCAASADNPRYQLRCAALTIVRSSDVDLNGLLLKGSSWNLDNFITTLF